MSWKAWLPIAVLLMERRPSIMGNLFGNARHFALQRHRWREPFPSAVEGGNRRYRSARY